MKAKKEKYSARLIYVERSFVATVLEGIFGMLKATEHPVKHFARRVYRHYGVKIIKANDTPSMTTAFTK